MPTTPVIPETITVHIGAPSDSGQNITETFSDYIKNVASSEIYPSWPEEAIKANVLAQISVALNRVFTEYYPARGYDFDITNSPAYDQTYVPGRDIFDNVSRIVDDVFDSYIRRTGNIEPLYAVFCDGIEVTCNGLQQWSSLNLAQQGLSYTEILKQAYGNDIEIVQNVPVQTVGGSAPAIPLGEGDSGRDVELVQIKLNRISRNFPGIPKIGVADGFFGSDTKEAVQKFQQVFSLTPDGIVGNATWYKINSIYNAVKNLSSLNSEGLRLSDVSTDYEGELKEGSSSPSVGVLQYYLAYISLFVPTVKSVSIDNSFGPSTAESVRSFQSTYDLTVNGVVDAITWDRIKSVYQGILRTAPYEFEPGLILPFPGRVLRVGVEGDDVRALQEYLNYISDFYPQIPKITPDGSFGPATAQAVSKFSEIFNLPGNPERVTAIKWNSIINIYDDLYEGNIVNEEQFPGFGIN